MRTLASRTPAPSDRPRVIAARAAAGIVGTVGILGIAGVPGATASATTTASVSPACEAGTLPGPQTGITVAEDGTAVFVGGDYRAHEAAAESEGRLVVGGDVTIEAGLLNLGRVGVGSGVVPAPGDVLVAGGDVTVAEGSRLDVNHGVTGGGDVRTGGTFAGVVELNGGTLHQRAADAAGAASAHRTALDGLSAELADLAPTGDLDTTGASPRLAGDGVSDPQVFSITTAEAAGLDTVVLADVGDSAVVVNVRGTDGRLDTVHTAAGDVAHRIDDGAALGAWAPRVVWNFPTATSLDLAGGSQLVGSVLAPRADVRQGAHTNGRLWVGGDLDLGTGGSGIEHHNYPWTGECVDVPAVTPPGGTTEENEENEEAGGSTPEPTTTPSTPSTSTPDDTPSTPAAPEAGETPATSGPGSGDDVALAAARPADAAEPTAAAAGAETTVPTANPAASQDELPRTGAQVGVAAAAAAVLLGAGGVLLSLRRRAALRTSRG